MVDCFHQKILNLELGRAIGKLPDKLRLGRVRRLGILKTLARTGPAYFPNDNTFAGEFFAQLAQALKCARKPVPAWYAFPIRQQMRGDVVDVLGQLRMCEPQIPVFGGGDRNVQARPRFVQVNDQRWQAEIAAQYRFVRDDRRVNIRIALRCGD